MKTMPQKLGNPAVMKPTKTDEDVEADFFTAKIRSTPKCREILRVLNEIFESLESLETFPHKANTISS